MKNQERKQDRLEELRSKISYTEKAQEEYKDRNSYLYIVNSFYLDELKQELERLKKIRQQLSGSHSPESMSH